MMGSAFTTCFTSWLETAMVMPIIDGIKPVRGYRELDRLQCCSRRLSVLRLVSRVTVSAENEAEARAERFAS